MKKDKFDPTIDEQLLENGFAYYNDCKFGPMSGWRADYDFYSLRLMRHDHGYWLILKCTAKEINIGSSNDAKEIINVRDSLSKLW